MNGQLKLLPTKPTAILFLLTISLAGVLQGQTAADASLQKAALARSALLNLPLSFERQGESDRERYVAQGQGYAIGLKKGRAVIGLAARGGKLVSIEFAGGREVSATPEDELPGKVNRYNGNDPKQWKTGLATFGKVVYKDIYPGIDVVYYGNQKHLEFDFVVKPGTDPRAIRMKIGGAGKLAIDGAGALVIDDSHDLKIALPAVYQETGGVRKKIAGRYELRGSDEVAFAVDAWDRTKPLVIDPILVYSGLIGGGTNTSTGYGIALDFAGNIYISGNTYATDFPAYAAIQNGASLSGDGFVMKIGSAGTGLIYSTYLGGSGYDALQAIAVDANSSAWVTGQTQSADFPMLNPIQGTYGGNTDAVVARFSSGGTLQFSTYLGGSGYDNAHSVAVDSANSAYIAGETESSNFPTTAGVLLTSPAGSENAFVVKINASAQKVYSTLAGGASYDGAYGIAVDSAGDAYLTGFTYSSSFVGAPGGGAQTSNGGGQDAFVAKLNPAGSALLYFTFLGGAGTDSGQSIAVDSTNNAYVAGSTTSTGLATQGAAQTSLASGYDGLIAKLNSTGSTFTYVSYLGGNRQDYITGLAIDSSGNAYVGGYTDSNSFPAVASLQPNFPGNPTSVFTTSNQGGSWNIGDSGINGAVLDISADPVTSGIILAATENGIFRTTNSGSTWAQSLALSYVVSLARSRVTSTTIYALSANNVYMSSDDGATWQYQGSLSTGNFEGLVTDPSTASTVYAYSSDSGIYVSTNGGAAWSAANSGLPAASVPFAVATSDGSLYASAPGYGIYKSTNQAGSWSAVNTGLPAGAAFYAQSLAASGNTIYAAAGTLYKTTNGGTNWAATTGSVPNGAYVIGVSPSNTSLVYASSGGGGVYVSTDGGTTWNAANSGISNLTQIAEFGFDPLNANHAVVVAPVSQVGFVAALNAAGSAFTYSTWFGAAGGNSYTNINGLTANSSGDVFITGYSSSDTGGAFPATTTAFDGATYGAYIARISGASVNCSEFLGPGSQTVVGAAQTLGLTAIAPGGCSWNAASNQSWATVTRGASDSGIDAVTVQLAANTTGASRTATITAGNASATITQADSGCNYTLSSYAINMAASGGTSSVNLTTASGCPWSITNPYPTAVSAVSAATGTSGTGNATINLTVGSNSGINSESFYLTIGTATLSIAQAGSCTYTFNPTSASFNASGGTGSFGVTASSGACSWFASTPNSWITLTGTASGTGNGTVNYSVAPNTGSLLNGAINVGGYSFNITETGPVGTSTTTGLTSSLNPSVFGQNVVLTASVSSSTATGTVMFMDGSTLLATKSLSAGVATFSTTALTPGTHSLTAVYSGDSNYASSTSTALSQVVNQVSTTTGLTASPNPSTFGQSVAFTATVTPSTAGGTVTFRDGNTSLGSISLTSGSAVLNTSALAVGTHSVTAVYNGDTNDLTSTSSAVSQQVSQANSQTVLTSSLNPSTFGATITLTATVTPAAATGTVTFKDGTTSIGTGTLSSGVATLAIATLSTGSHSLTASYPGDTNDLSSASSAITQTVNQGRATTYLTFTPNPAVVGQTVTLTANVIPSLATGTITFKDGTTSLGTAMLSGGTASISTSTLAVGSHSLTASYGGDTNFPAGNSQSGPALFFTSPVTGTILDSTGKGTGFPSRLPGTGTSIASQDPNLTLNTSAGTLTWTTTPIDLNGQVNLAGGDFIGFPLSAAGVTLNEDFSLSATFLNVQYGLDFDQFGLFAGTSSSNAMRGGALVTFGPSLVAYTEDTIGGTDSNQQTSTALAPSPGDNVTFTLSRTSGVWALSIQNLTTPSKSGAIPIVQPTYLNGVAGLTAGVYASNARNTTARTEVLSSFAFAGATETVLSPTTTTTLSSAPSPSTVGQTVTLTATVSPSAATGTVTFLDGSSALGSASLNSGVASFTTSALAMGSHSLTASYAGNGTFSASSSSTVTQMVTTNTSTSTALTSSLNPSSFGQNVVFTASVTPSSAVGFVTFADANGMIGMVALSSGMATFATAGLTAGSHSITASYSGGGTFAASVSSTLTQTVNQAATTTTLTPSPNPVQSGQTVTLTAAVTPSGATGSITFKDGSNTIGVANLSQGTASIALTLSGGTHSLTAVYSGDQNNAASTSSTVNETVNLPTLTITTTSLPQGMLNQAYGPVTLAATGGSGAYTWSATGLPAGLSVSGGGSLGGTPTALFNGSITVNVSDSISHATASASLSLSVAATPLTLNGPSTLGSVVTGAAVSATFTVSGGVSPYTWTLTGVSGLSVDSNGHVTGTAGAPGNYSASLTVTDSQNTSASRTLSLSSFGITTGSLPPGTTNTAYSAAITAAGGTPNYTFTASGLPPGVTFSGGSFGGTPTTPGTYSISVHASDSGGLSVTATYSVTVTSGAAPLSVYTTSLSSATAGQSYSGTVSATGGTSPYTWSQSGGVLPAGMSFSSSGQVTGTANVPGNYSLGVQVTDGHGAIAVGSVTLNVLPAPLQITNSATFPAGIAGSDYPAQQLTASGGVPPYTFSINGSLPGGLALSGSQIAGTPQSAGTYNFTVKATDSATPPSSGLLGVTLNVRPQSADLVLASSSLSFSITAGTSSPPSANTVGVASSVVSQNISFSTAVSVSWLTVSGGSSTPGVVSVAPNNAALSLTAAGSPYSGTVTVTCNSGTCAGTSQSIAVSLTVTSPPALLSLGTSLLSFASLTSNPQTQTASLPVSNAGGGQLQITSATSDSPWLTVSAPPATVAPGPGVSLTVTANPTGLAAGYYRGVITIASSGGTATAAVTLFISGAATISLGPSGSQFSLPQGGVLGLNTGSFNVNASNGASVPFTASVVATPWLSLTNTSGTATTGVPATVGFTIDPNAASAFATGTYYGTIQVSATGAANTPQAFIVVLNVTSATTTVIPNPQPAGLVFVSTGSATPPPSQTVYVYASSRTPLPFQASASEDTGAWLSISTPGLSASANTGSVVTGSASGGSPGMVSVNVNPAGLAAGAYRGLVSFASGSSVRSVNVTLIVEPAQSGHAISSNAAGPLDSGPVCANAQLVPTQTGLVDNFSVPTAWPTPLSVQLFDTCGSVVGNAQIVATFSNGDPPLPLPTVSAGSGVYSGTWTPRRASSQITITASVTASGYPGALVKISGQSPSNNAPVLAPNGAGDVFNPQVGAGLGPGNIIQIYGSGLAILTSTPAILPLPTTVTGTSVIIGGLQAPLFYVSPTQINAQIPFSLSAGNQYQLLVSANGALTTPLSLQLNAGAPAILNFTSGAVVAQHLDGTLVTATSPAVPSEYIVIYSSGLGATDIPVASGAASPSNPPANVADPPVLTLNGNSINILFAGLTPGLVGLYQVNFQVPATLAAGNYDLQLTQSGTQSNTTVLPIAAPPPQ